MPLLHVADALLGTAGVTWTLTSLALLRSAAAVPRLPVLASASTGGERPRVTAVVPARDEAERIGETVGRLLRSRGVDLEVVVVDDRSSDATGAIVAKLAREDAEVGARVRLVRVDALPEGWLGKPHACQRGGEVARSEWILFTDGDVHLAGDVIARAVAAARAEHVEHVVLAPGVESATLPARAGLAAFSLGLIGHMGRANRDERFGWIGIGAFNLVAADAWRAIGGHERLRYEVVDDMKLGLLLRRGGFRTRAFLAGRDVTAAWGRSAREILRLLEKNQFAFLGYHTFATLAFVLAAAALWLAGPLGFAYGGAIGWFAGIAWLSTSIPSAIVAARSGEHRGFALLAPLGFPLILATVVRSTWTTLRQGGVRWRGTLYPLAALRAGCVRGFSARSP
jgi:cellulose synthase/poly-beta-1,6-N-acetylglucosamine synthase-like glycosyltransferase